VIGDPLRFKQVITNLVSNGIKFTERGHVLVSIREDARRDSSTRLHVQVTDTGIGIAADQQVAVFEAFKQADGSTTRRFGGTGLGLTISSSLVDMMGGRMWVESESGHGCTFHFTAAFDIPRTASPVRDTSRIARERLLIVDDNAVSRRVLEAHAAGWGMRPTSVGGGQEAIEALKISIWSEETAAAHAVLGEAYRQERDLSSARAEADRALAIDPTSAEAKALVARLGER